MARTTIAPEPEIPESPAGLRVTPTERLLLVELDYRVAPCDQACVFCPERYVLDRRPSAPKGGVAAVIAEVEALLADDPRDLYLESGDILGFEGLDALIGLAEARGRRTYVASPGTRLADRSVVERFAGRAVRFDLTVHGVSDAVWAAMTGRADVGVRVRAALDHLSELGVPHRVSMVVTDRNVHELADTVRLVAARWRPEEIALKLFAVDSSAGGTGSAHPDFLDQYPDFVAVSEALLSVVDVPNLPALAIDNLPFCQLEPSLVEHLPLKLLPCWNTYRAYALSACTHCPARPTCVGVHLAYVRRHRLRRPDVAAAGRLAGA